MLGVITLRPCLPPGSHHTTLHPDHRHSQVGRRTVLLKVKDRRINSRRGLGILARVVRIKAIMANNRSNPPTAEVAGIKDGNTCKNVLVYTVLLHQLYVYVVVTSLLTKESTCTNLYTQLHVFIT